MLSAFRAPCPTDIAGHGARAWAAAAGRSASGWSPSTARGRGSSTAGACAARSPRGSRRSPCPTTSRLASTRRRRCCGRGSLRPRPPSSGCGCSTSSGAHQRVFHTQSLSPCERARALPYPHPFHPPLPSPLPHSLALAPSTLPCRYILCGTPEFFLHSYRDLPARATLTCDGRPVAIPPGIEGLMVRSREADHTPQRMAC